MVKMFPAKPRVILRARSAQRACESSPLIFTSIFTPTPKTSTTTASQGVKIDFRIFTHLHTPARVLSETVIIHDTSALASCRRIFTHLHTHLHTYHPPKLSDLPVTMLTSRAASGGFVCVGPSPTTVT